MSTSGTSIDIATEERDNGSATGRRGRRATAAMVTLVLVAVVLVGAPTPAAAQHHGPDPVVIVAGTFSPAFANEPLAARLRADGYQVHIFELPGLGLGDIRSSSAALGAFVDQVLASSGATRVDLVGHSQGGLVARGYVRDFGGAAKVDSLISLGSPHKGTYVANLANFFGFGNCLAIVACEQMRIGSSYLQDLNAGSDTIAPVRYTNIYTSYDELVRPVSNAALSDGAVNIRVQSQCWARVVGHVGLIVDGTVYSGVRQALEGRSNIRLNCWAW
ncbi:MAG: alpha/beta fold hydrolase [Acidimicrobiia bacterium]|nr:alpha/beta fold hydrolase [Acidimicrobiia bacterium]